MLKQNLIILIIGFCFYTFFSSLFIIHQTYEHRSLFALLEKSREIKEVLTSKSGYLHEEISYLESQNTINRIAREGMRMHTPKIANIIRVFERKER